MLQAIEGIYRNGKIELLEEPTASEGMRVIVTFLDSPAARYRDKSWGKGLKAFPVDGLTA